MAMQQDIEPGIYHDVTVDVDDLILGDPSILGLAGLFDANVNQCISACVVRYGLVYIADDPHSGVLGTLASRRATVAHELGHVFLLKHESVNQNETVAYNCGFDNTGMIPHSVMAYDCILPASVGGLGEFWVQGWDVCGINTKYPGHYSTAGCPAKQKKLFPHSWYKTPSNLTTSQTWYNSCDAGCPSRWASPVGHAINDWNGQPSVVKMAMQPDLVPPADYEITPDVDDLVLGDPSVLGVAVFLDENGELCAATCTVRYASPWLADDAHAGAYGTLEQRRATIAHELGHLFGLAHESVGHECGQDETGEIPHTVMSFDCSDPVAVGGEGEFWVQDWDVCGVNQKYPGSFGDAGCLSAPSAPSYYHPVNPCRLLDTRSSNGGHPGKFGAGESFSLATSGRCGLPAAGVLAVVLNTTVTGPTASSFLTLYPSNASRPNSSNLNFAAGETRPNAATVRVGNDGKVRIYNSSGSTHVIVDIAGWYGISPTGGALYNPLNPARILDTRNGTGGISGKIGSSPVTFKVAGKGGIPSTGVSAVVVNTTVTGPTQGSFLTMYPADAAGVPAASNLNYGLGQTVANLVTVKVSAAGEIKLSNFAGSTHVILDVAGWYGANGQFFRATTPARAMDTRIGTGGRTGTIPGGFEQVLDPTEVGGLPTGGVTAVAVNLTATQPTSPGYLSLYQTYNVNLGRSSNLNFTAGQTVANAAIINMPQGEEFYIYNYTGQTHVIVDVAGWFGP
jgi:hypothetical protein